jgi:hypothetical protein
VREARWPAAARRRRQPEREHGGGHRRRAGEEHRDQADQQRGQDLGGQPARGGQQAEHDEQADLGQPADALGEAAGGRVVWQARVAERDRRHVHREEAASRRDRCGPVDGDDQPEHGDGVQAGGGQRRPAQQVPAGQAGQQADDQAADQLPGDLPGDQPRRRVVPGGLARPVGGRPG